MEFFTDHTNVADFLKHFLESKKDKNKSLSVRAFAQKLGYKNSTLVNDVINKKRKPTTDLVLRMADAYDLPVGQKEYLVRICELERAKNFSEKELAMSRIKNLFNDHHWKVFESKHHDVLINPYSMLIFSLVRLKGFKPTEAYCRRHLRISLTQAQIDLALESLLKIGYLKETSPGKYVGAQDKMVITSGEKTMRPHLVMKCHLQYMDFIRQIYQTTVAHERDVRAMIMPIRKADLPVIAEELQKFQTRLTNYGLDLKPGDEAEEIVFIASQLVPINYPVKLD